jgi:protein XagA
VARDDECNIIASNHYNDSTRAIFLSHPTPMGYHRGMRLGWVVLCVIVGLASSAHAGAWVQPQGRGLFIAQASYYTTDTYFDTNGNAMPQPRFTKYELQPYAEYGVSEWLTLGGSAYAQTVSQSGQHNYGIADPELFAKVRIYEDASRVVSIQPLVKLASRFGQNSAVRGGSKSTDMELSGLYGQSMHLLSPRDYADIRLGYRQRDRGLSPQWRGDVALGLGITDSIQIIPALRTVMSTQLTDAAAFREGGDLDYNVLKAEVTGLYHLSDTQWIQAGVFSHVAGIQTGDGYGITVGFAQEF